jgi:hypothetical protein
MTAKWVTQLSNQIGQMERHHRSGSGCIGRGHASNRSKSAYSHHSNLVEKKGERVNDPNSQQINMHIQNIEAGKKVTGQEEADARVEDRDDVDVHIWLKQRLAHTQAAA